MGMHKTRSGFTLLELIIALAVIMIVTGGVFLALRQPERRHLQNASLQLQADIRYVQRRSIAEGRRFGIRLDRGANNYQVATFCYNNNVDEVIRVVNFQNGVRLEYPPRGHNLIFLPRGTISGAGGPVSPRLHTTRYFQRITIVPSGGRAEIQDIEELRQR